MGDGAYQGWIINLGMWDKPVKTINNVALQAPTPF